MDTGKAKIIKISKDCSIVAMKAFPKIYFLHSKPKKILVLGVVKKQDTFNNKQYFLLMECPGNLFSPPKAWR